MYTFISFSGFADRAGAERMLGLVKEGGLIAGQALENPSGGIYRLNQEPEIRR